LTSKIVSLEFYLKIQYFNSYNYLSTASVVHYLVTYMYSCNSRYACSLPDLEEV